VSVLYRIGGGGKGCKRGDVDVMEGYCAEGDLAGVYMLRLALVIDTIWGEYVGVDVLSFLTSPARSGGIS